jgi:hypothetical protein
MLASLAEMIRTTSSPVAMKEIWVTTISLVSLAAPMMIQRFSK